MSTRRRTTTRIDVSIDRGVFMISVAAELAEMHPQTLRMYEARGLIEPQRSPKGTRLYSQSDVEKLRRIQEMTAELGLNLAGVERVLDLEQQLARAKRRIDALERQLADARREAEASFLESEHVKQQAQRGELVPYRRGDIVAVPKPAAGREREAEETGA
jgi:MerR family transcriptional regulator/heat shock protein HspR